MDELKMKVFSKQSRQLTFTVVIAAVLSILMIGCGEPEGRSAEETAKKLEYVQELRSYFDKANGNWDSLTETDKADFVKLSGSEEQAKKNWDGMKYGPDAGNKSPEAPR